VANAPPNNWTAAPFYGANDTTGTANIYFEENQVINVQEALDIDDNCRGVIRYNTFRDATAGTHGADTSPYGVRHFEIYNNTFTFAGNSLLNQWVFIRGGSGIIADNVMPDIPTKSEIKIQIQNLRRNAGPYPCWDNGWPAPHQIGQGHNGSTSVVEGLYIWNNSGGGKQTPFAENFAPDQCSGGVDVNTHVQSGRDFFVGTPKPGYTKYRYPHPLRSSTGDGGSGGDTPSAEAPSVPQNLRIVSE
jgi:hypothetical protein